MKSEVTIDTNKTSAGNKEFSAYKQEPVLKYEAAKHNFEVELLINLGNYSNIKFISRKSGDNKDQIIKEIYDDFQDLKDEFLNRASTLLD